MSKRLEDLDLKEVSEKTRIEPEFFQALMTKDFEELSKFNVKGFFKILNREYGLDLSNELAEYEAFLNKDEEKPVASEKESKVVTNVEQYSKETSSVWLWVAIVVVIAAIIAIIVKFDLLTGFVSEDKGESESVSVVQSIDDAQSNLQENGTENNESIEFVEPSEPNEANASVQSVEPASTAPQTNAQEIQSTQSTAQRTPAQSAPQTLNEAINSSEFAKKEAIFSTDGKVWVGFIDLTTRTNSSIVTDSNFSVDLSKDQLLLIGGTALTLVDETGEVQSFPSGNSKRFLVKDGKIKSISLSEFMSYNRGKEW